MKNRTKPWLKTLAAACALLPLALGSAAPVAFAQVDEPAAVAAAAPAETRAAPALWVVKDEDTTIYLFGSIHVLKPGLSWFDGAVKQAFDASDSLMLEVVLPEDEMAAAKATIPLALDQSGRTLSSRLEPDALKAYQAALAGLGIPPAQFDAFKPWFAAVTLSVLPLTNLGYDPEQGAEKTLTRAAKAAGKPVEGLETLEEQLGFFDTLPEDQQVAYLNATVKDIDQLGPTIDRLVTLWGNGDPDQLAVLMNESMTTTPELAKILLADRNARWAETLQARMEQPGTLFVAVGAGHLAGPQSVQTYLQQRGLAATRVE